MTKIVSHEIRLRARPTGRATAELFEMSETEVGDPDPGEVRVRNLIMSVDPYMRGRLVDRPSYVPPFALGEPLNGGAVGVVESSNDPGVSVGSLVLSGLGWREAYLAPAATVQVVAEPAAGTTLGAYLGVLGMPGLTAWVGITEVAPVAPGETMFVSAAAGAVGSAAGQIARLRGVTVVGSAGAEDKVAYLRDVLHFDAAFSYRTDDLRGELRKAAPEGIDVYFDNVGGAQLDAALIAMKPGGRVALCGAINGYDSDDGGEPVRALAVAIGKRITLRGFIVNDFNDRRQDFLDEVMPRLASGEIVAPETTVDGLSAAPGALLDLLNSGPQIGKLLVSLAQR